VLNRWHDRVSIRMDSTSIGYHFDKISASTSSATEKQQDQRPRSDRIRERRNDGICASTSSATEKPQAQRTEKRQAQRPRNHKLSDREATGSENKEMTGFALRQAQRPRNHKLREPRSDRLNDRKTQSQRTKNDT
jgi:hypothetical protein